MSDLKNLLEPISAFVPELDLSDAGPAEAALNERFPPGSDEIGTIRSAAFAALAAGEIAERGEPGMKWGRLAKPEDTTGGSSIDVVYMSDSSGPAHTHTKGEVCLCFGESESATFENRGDTWIVMPAGSRHEPTVRGGSMLILYWLPEGAVKWG